MSKPLAGHWALPYIQEICRKMLPYELAKQLAEAGFPRPDNWRDLAYFADGEIYIPALSHLIEACGDKFGVLERFHGGTFGAYMPNDIGKSALGETPQEAVAKLWLLIQAEKDQAAA